VSNVAHGRKAGSSYSFKDFPTSADVASGQNSETKSALALTIFSTIERDELP
jgi:hypothetical protein